jgi:hypothetical protein
MFVPDMPSSKPKIRNLSRLILKAAMAAGIVFRFAIPAP